MGLNSNIQSPVCTWISKAFIGLLMFELQFKPSVPPALPYRKATSGLNPDF